MTPSRKHSSASGLTGIFSPRSIAVVGASERIGSVGRAVVENLALFEGAVYLVNPNHKRLFGKRCFHSVAETEKDIDLAVIATPSATVPEVVRDCVTHAIRGAIILSAGFKEIGEAGRELERQITQKAGVGGMRILGPNCLGAMIPNNNLNVSFAKRMPKPGNIALLSQSGALCAAILDWSFRENIGFSAFVSIGSMIDVDWGDLIEYFGDDPQTKSILCYMESVGDARSFMSAAREAALAKPVVILKAGRSAEAAAAAASHTGNLTGSDAVVDAAFRRCGALRVNSLDELLNMAELLGKQTPPSGSKLVIVTNAGGPGVLAADSLVANGARLADLSPATVGRLNSVLPTFWSHRNPVDVLGDADAARFIKTLECVASDTGNDGALALLSPQAMTDVKAVSFALRDCAARIQKPVLACWIGGVSVAAGRAILNNAHIPTFDTPEAATRAFALAWKHTEEIQRLYETPDDDIPVSTWNVSHSIAGGIIDSARKSGRTILDAAESAEVVRAYGIPVIDTHIALDEHDAVQAAQKLGLPVAVKLHSTTVMHKSEVGGVVLNAASPADVSRAWRSIKENLSNAGKPEGFHGVTIQPMINNSGVELIFGGVIDSQFGPTIMFGAGGKWVEIMQDAAIGLPPLNGNLARRLMERTKIFSVLKGVRGEKSADIKSLELLLVRFAELIIRERGIAEIEINPLFISGNRAIAVDVRVILQPKSVNTVELPKPAIRPYPLEYVWDLRLKNGTPVTLRPVRPEDEPLMVEFHQMLSDRSVYLRYFAPLKLDRRIQHDRLCRRCYVDYDRELGLIAEHSTTDRNRQIVGVGRLTRPHLADEAEFALLIADEWQGQGLGTQLLSRLVEVGQREKLSRITGLILEENRVMRHLAENVGFRIRRSSGDFLAEIEIPTS